MKAITLHQPWATLVALGVKTIETRSWAPPKALIGERLLIHAGADRQWLGHGIGPWQAQRALPGVRDEPAVQVTALGREWYPLPFGAIVASCVLTDAVPMVEWSYRRWAEGAPPVPRLLVDPASDRLGIERLIGGVTGELLGYLHTVEVEGQRPYGDFAPGRWAWLLEDVKPTTERCPACWHSPFDLEPCLHGLHEFGCGGNWSDCTICNGSGACPPIPAKGHQRIWDCELPSLSPAT